mmetsp:Transcript_43383/g.98716  ORF Transcript_43383/g.98716 Transcript_43383/m.98716 type:complete len:542 (+) Transcript_43383:136-1761(+)
MAAKSILNTICEQRAKDVEVAKAEVSLEELKAKIEAANKEFPPIDFAARLRKDAAAGVAVVAEIKRASPSKGDIAIGIVAGEQGLKYARAGASGISVLTEPTWFKGNLDDMRDVRRQVASEPERPAILRKDFLIDEYQIYEARVYGADTVLLIVAVLEEAVLTGLINCARALAMESLVEVNNDAETKIALRAGARIIGVNNRNLHNFAVDATTTEAVMATNREALEKNGVMLCALSGIQSRVDVQRYTVLGVEMVLVGEALMRSSDPSRLIATFRGLDRDSLLVKSCGFKDVPGAITAAKAGSDFIGLVFAEGSPRTVSQADARAMIHAVNIAKCQPETGAAPPSKKAKQELRFTFEDQKLPREEMVAKLRAACAKGPLFVGVFANQDRAVVKKLAEDVGLDVIQLSGHEGWEDLAFYAPFPVINAQHVGADDTFEGISSKVGTEAEAILMLDTKHPTMEGGCGETFDWKVAAAATAARPTFIAGGLAPGNVALCVQETRPFAVDASSGMEKTKGVKDPELVFKYVHAAKTALAEKDLIIE